MKLLFFETRGTSLQRFPLWISKSAMSLFQKENLNLVYFSEDSINMDTREVVEKTLGKLPNFFSKKCFSVKAYKRVLEKEKPSIVIVFAHRLPDLALIMAAKSLDITTVYYQHGLYIPFMRREPRLFLSNLGKSFRYALCSLSIGKEADIGCLAGFWSYFDIFVRGKNIHETNLPCSLLIANHCFVYGDHWVDYHIEEYGYEASHISIVGTPDLAGIDLDEESPVRCSSEVNEEYEFCYVAQTLVEDGRIERALMESFLVSLGQAVKSCGGTLAVKLHPRSDLNMYELLDCEAQLTRDFPKSKVYIGHYSTMLVRGVEYTDNYLLIDFDGHEIPEYLRLLATEIVQSSDENAMNSALCNLNRRPVDESSLYAKRQNLKKYFHSNSEDPFDRVAAYIFKLAPVE